MRKGNRLHPIIFGGGHEGKLRSGTMNIPSIAGFCLAAEKKIDRMKEDQKKSKIIREILIKELEKSPEINMHINSPKDGIENIINISFEKMRSETMLHFLEIEEIYVSSGSACHSKRNTTSHG